MMLVTGASPVRVGVNQHFQIMAGYSFVAEADHISELPHRVDMEERREPRRIESLSCEVEYEDPFFFKNARNYQFAWAAAGVACSCSFRCSSCIAFISAFSTGAACGPGMSNVP